MPKLALKETVHIDAPPAEVFSRVADFSHWTAWSPWLIMEPEAKVTVDDGGKSYAWEGERVGSGNMQVTAEQADQWIDYDLNFFKPFKSSAKVRFELSEREGGTEAAWLMDSSLPFFLFFMAKSMTAMIAQDYRRGLTMLKDYTETGSAGSRLEIAGEQDFPGWAYVGVRRHCRIDEISSSMEQSFHELMSAMQGASLTPAGAPFSIYHQFRHAANLVDYTAGLPVAAAASVAAPLTSGEIAAGRVFTVRHTGPYRHIGNGWALAYNLVQNKAFKPAKRQAPFEVYVNDPADTPEAELITDIHFRI